MGGGTVATFTQKHACVNIHIEKKHQENRLKYTLMKWLTIVDS